MQDHHDHDSPKQDGDHSNMIASRQHARLTEIGSPLDNPSVEYDLACKYTIAAVRASKCDVSVTDGRSYAKNRCDNV